MNQDGKKWENLLTGLIAGLGALGQGFVVKGIKNKVEDIYRTSMNKLDELINPPQTQSNEPETITIPANQTDLDKPVTVPNPNYTPPQQPASFDKLLTTYLDMRGRLAKYGDYATPYMGMLDTFMNTQLAMMQSRAKMNEKNVYVTNQGEIFAYDKYGNVTQLRGALPKEGTYIMNKEGIKYSEEIDENGNPRYYVTIPFYNNADPSKTYSQTLEIDEDTYINKTINFYDQEDYKQKHRIELLQLKKSGRGSKRGSGFPLKDNTTTNKTTSQNTQKSNQGWNIFNTANIQYEVGNAMTDYNNGRIDANTCVQRINDALIKYGADKEYIKDVANQLKQNTGIEVEFEE